MYLKRLLLVIGLVCGSAYLLGYFFDQRYRKRMQYHVFDKVDEALHTNSRSDFNVIYLGNSRVHGGINPYYVDSITGLHSFNFALGACDEQEMKLITTLYLQNHTPPQIAVIGVDKAMLVKYNILKERFPYLFYVDRDSVSAYMRINGFPTGIIRVFPFIKYSFFDEYNRTAIFVPGPRMERSGHSIYNGFVNLFGDQYMDSTSKPKNRDPLSPKELPRRQKINDTSAAVFEQTVQLLQSKGTQVVFLFCPSRLKKEITDSVTNLQHFFLALANRKNIPILRADTSSLYTREYFYDNFHLNEPGSRILSRQVGAFINELRKNNQDK